MNGGAKFLACTALLAIGACTGESGKLEIRSLPTPLAQGKQPVPMRVAEGHQQLALGNVALALEAYRKASREDLNSIDALAGIAVCYDRMGRFDLSRRSYEAALAIEPGNTLVLAMLAASLEQQGKKSEALAVRDEILQRMAAAKSAGTPPPAPAAELTAVAAVILPPAAAAEATAVAAVILPPAPAVQSAAPDTEIPLPAPNLTSTAPAIEGAPLSVSSGGIAPPLAIAAFAPDEPATPVEVTPAKPVAVAEAPRPARTVTISLPAPTPAPSTEGAQPARPVQLAASPVSSGEPAPAKPMPQVPAQLATQVAATVPPAKPQRSPSPLPVTTGRGPKLERRSLGEVALVTGRGPQWSSLVVKQDQRSATVRFVPLRQASMRFASVRLLNAARVQGLAARTRSTLFDRGWRSIAIGDAKAIRARSLILYPAHRRATALSLARQFGFRTALRASGRDITVLLGRDAAILPRRLPAA